MHTLLLIIAALGISDADTREKPLNSEFLREFAITRGYMLGRPVKATPSPDGSVVLFLRSGPTDPTQSLFEFDCKSGQTHELLSPGDILKSGKEELSPEEKARRERMRVSAAGFTNFQFDPDGSRVLLSLSGRLFVLDRSTEKVRELKTGDGTIVDPKWSPDGKLIGYVKDEDVFVYELATDQERAVTTGGTPEKTHGLAEFVAQEEMSRFSGYWWSPDSKSIAYTEADASGVEVWYVGDPNEPSSAPRPQFYPRPGKPNVKVRLGIKAIDGGDTVWVEWDHKKYEYLASVHWGKYGPMTITMQDRKQQELVVLRVDPKTGEPTTLLAQQDPAWLNLYQEIPRWLPNGKQFFFIVQGPKSDELHLLATDNDKSIKIHENVVEFLAYDEKHRFVYSRVDEGTNAPFVVRSRLSSEGQPENREELDWDLGVQAVTFSKDRSIYVQTVESWSQLPKVSVYGCGDLPSVAKDPPFRPNAEIDGIGTGDRHFMVAVVKPRDFDSGKKYPVIVDVYGGPRHIHVQQRWRMWLRQQWLADQGFIVVAIDNRGTPNRGRAWERPIYQKLGSVPLDDQILGVQLLAKKHPEMDLERVGIVGWSFGGYMSALAVLKRPDVFKAAVAGAPVTDWKDYDTHYTERYMGLLPESESAYEESSLIPLASKLERPLLLVHGTADDNVYFRHTLKLTNALFRAGKDFEVLPLPSLTHMVPDPVVAEQLWSRIARHFEKHLGEPR